MLARLAEAGEARLRAPSIRAVRSFAAPSDLGPPDIPAIGRRMCCASHSRIGVRSLSMRRYGRKQGNGGTQAQGNSRAID